MPRTRPPRKGPSDTQWTQEQKVEHIKQRYDTSQDHHCHWPGCKLKVHPARWGCRKHWLALPRSLRSQLWSVYRPGQEEDKRPSREYVEVAREIREWIEKNFPDG